MNGYALIRLSTWSQFKVQTFDSTALKSAAYELAGMAHEFQPNIIVGIRSGGYNVAEPIKEKFPQARLLAITCRRPGTAKKNKYSITRQILSGLPHAVTDRLRIIEHIILTQLFTPIINVMIPDDEEIVILREYLNELGADARVLVVDDAVDRGVTMDFVRKIIKAIANPAATTKMASVTVTTVSPLIEPDFSLYRYVLCRFPWSLDFRN